MTRARAWTLLPSRRRFDLLAPDPWAWTDEDLRPACRAPTAGLGVTLDPLADDPLPTPTGLWPWQPWPPRRVASLFLSKPRERATADSGVGSPDDLDGASSRDIQTPPPGPARSSSWPARAPARPRS